MSGRGTYYKIRVQEVIRETPDAHSLVLDIPAELAEVFTYRAGQYLTVRLPDHEDLARCYSLSSSPHLDEPHKITIKRVPDGRASNWICDRVAAGDALEVRPPAGHFAPAGLDDDLLMLAGGSGITPVISIVKSVLTGGRGRIALVYANRDPQSIIFAEELGTLTARYADRLCVTHWLDSTQGPPSPEAWSALLAPYAERNAYLCGPEPFVKVCRGALAAAGVPDERIHVEQFQSTVEGLMEEPGEPVATAEVELDGQLHRLPWAANTRLLDLLINAGLNPPYSCRQGTCGACACRVLDGEVELVHNEVLEDEDFAEGYTLACQALPRSETIKVTYS